MKTVLLVNYGSPGTDKRSAKEYLKNLFSDKRVFPLPAPLRFILSRLVSNLRWRESVEILKTIGGSPLLKQTEEQAEALRKRLGEDYRVLYAMRYSEPLLEKVLEEIPESEEPVLLPMFPQYSKATWGTVLELVEKKRGEKFKVVKPFYSCPEFVRGWKRAVERALKGLKNPFLLFSAHSLPLYLVKKYGDPYPLQVEETAKLIAKDFDIPFKVAYQSRLGPIRWLSPTLEEALSEVLKKGFKEVVVVPVSFTTENSETLYELDVYLKEFALKGGFKKFVRVKVPYKNPLWVECFAELLKGTF